MKLSNHRYTLKTFLILILWIGASQSIFILPSEALAKEGLLLEALANAGSSSVALANAGSSSVALAKEGSPFELIAKEGFVQIDIESKKIEFLLKEVEQLKGAKFLRNGSSYSPKQAADHLRMKWNKAGSSLKTAKDFIEKIASKSSMSGKAYEIEFADGTKTETKVFLSKKLSEWKE